jgi:hypothetical protein
LARSATTPAAAAEPLPILYKFKLDANGNVDPNSYRKMTRNEIVKVCPKWFDD